MERENKVKDRDPAVRCGVFENSGKKGTTAMRYLPNGTQMKKADEYTIQTIGIPSIVLMERAALKVVEAMENAGIDLSRPLIVCGSGNNGGDGFAAARLLREKDCDVSALFVGREESMSQECRLQRDIVRNSGIEVLTGFPEKEYSVIVDAAFGVGLSREITGHYDKVIRWMNERKGQKVAIDIPSGICSCTGRVLGNAFRAQITVAVECEKLGCALFPGKNYAGRTIVVPIGIDKSVLSDMNDICFTYNMGELPALLPARKEDSHKGSYGRILMITGSNGMAGASFLSACAAYSVGAGLVQIYTSEANRPVLQQLLPEAVMSTYTEFDADRLDELLEWADVVCIGCGLGQSSLSEKIFVHTMKNVRVPCVIDADGLNLLSRHMELLEQCENNRFVLTPHMKEMSRLTGRSVESISEDRMQTLDRFTERYPAVCVLKDSRTAVACRGKQKFLNLAGNSAMAKAGSGDVLAGVIAGFLGQKMDLFQGAALGVWVHACGGDRARDAMGEYSVLARDLITGIQKCIKEAEEYRK